MERPRRLEKRLADTDRSAAAPALVDELRHRDGVGPSPVPEPPEGNHRPRQAYTDRRTQNAKNPAGNPPARRPRGPLYAALDLGTNNCRLLIARPHEQSFRVLDGFTRIVRLGEGLSTTGRLSDAAMERTMEALRQCRNKLREHEPARMRLIATEACRSASNGLEFIARVETELGLKLEIVDRQTEAALAVTGCAVLIDGESAGALMFDIGGGSSELAWLDFRGGRPRVMVQLRPGAQQLLLPPQRVGRLHIRHAAMVHQQRIHHLQHMQLSRRQARQVDRLPRPKVRQRLAGRPGSQQLGLRGRLGLRGLGAGALLQVHGIEHQQQGCDKGHRVDGPELVLQGNIAKPGTHGQVFSELSGNNIGKVPSLCLRAPWSLLMHINTKHQPL